MGQEWRIYAPEGRDVKYDTKMHLRNKVKMAHILGEVPLKLVNKDNYCDDIYFMNISGENVRVVAREPKQRSCITGVFDSISSGIFYYVSDDNYKNAESALVESFS